MTNDECEFSDAVTPKKLREKWRDNYGDGEDRRRGGRLGSAALLRDLRAVQHGRGRTPPPRRVCSHQVCVLISLSKVYNVFKFLCYLRFCHFTIRFIEQIFQNIEGWELVACTMLNKFSKGRSLMLQCRKLTGGSGRSWKDERGSSHHTK